MARKTKVDYRVFDEECNNVSDLVKMFTQKTKKVQRIFEDNDEIPIPDKSYGLRVVSINKTNEDAVPAVTNDKENMNEPVKTKSQTSFIQPLPEVPIVPAPADQILESRSPFKNPLKPNRQNLSLRRSLFQSQPGTSKQKADIICSTPFSKARSDNDFFESSSNRTANISPIRKGLSNTVMTEDDLRGFQVIDRNKDGKASDKTPVKVITLRNYEDDLRLQFDIHANTPKKAQSEVAHKRPSVSKDIQPSPARSEPVTKNCSVVVQNIDISKEAISIYRKQQMSRLSTSNQTNFISMNMIETPVARQKRNSAVNNSLLAKKLALCDSDPEMTDDESQEEPPKKTPKKSLPRNQTNVNTENMIETPIIRQEKKSIRPNSLLAKKLAVCESDSETDVTEDNSQPIEKNDKKSSNNQNCNKANSNSEPEPTQNDSESETEQPQDDPFKNPNDVLKIMTLTTTSNMSSNGIVPIEIVKSFRTLQKTTVDTTQSEASASLRVIKPKSRPKRKAEVNEKAKTYLRVIKPRAKNVKGNRRTLFTEDSYSEDVRRDELQNNEDVQVEMFNNGSGSESECDEELRLTIESIQNSLETQKPMVVINNEPKSNSEESQKILRSSNKNQELDNEQMETDADEEPSKRMRVRNKISSNAESVQTSEPMQTETAKGKPTGTRGRSRKIKVPDAVPESSGSKSRKRQNTAVNEDEPPKKSNRRVIVEASNSSDKNTVIDDEPPKKSSRRVVAEASSSSDKNTVIDDEPPKKSSRRVVAEPSSSSDKDAVTDEGFQSEDDSGVRYDPYKRGCQRPGLRKRRYMRPYWIHSGETCYISYGTYTQADARASRLQKKYHIQESQLNNNNPLGMFLAPSAKLDLIKEIGKTNKRKPKTKNIVKQREEAKAQERMEVDTVASFETAKTTYTHRTVESHADMVNRVFETFNNIDQNSTSTSVNFSTPEFYAAQINKLSWIHLGQGVWYAGFNEGAFDGFMKFEGDAFKKKAKTKHSICKFTLLCGKLEFTISDQKVEISNLGHVCIRKGQQYTIKNPLTETAVALVTRLDASDLQ